MNFSRLSEILKAAEQAESAAFPLFFHSANGQGIAGAILMAEEVAADAIPSIAAAVHPVKTTPPAPVVVLPAPGSSAAPAAATGN